LHKRARDVTRLLMPYEPTEVVAGFADYKARHPKSLISQLHVFPLGGIKTAAEWMKNHASPADIPAFA
jgi:methylenetetrahydrofolate reductase (NADPH)